MALLGYNGGLRGKPRIPSTSNASGIWDLDEQKIAASAGIWPLPAQIVARNYRIYVNYLTTEALGAPLSITGGVANTYGTGGPSLSAKGTILAYGSTLDTGRNAMVYKLSGSTYTLLPCNPENVANFPITWAAVSPNGLYVAFMSNSSPGTIWIYKGNSTLSEFNYLTTVNFASADGVFQLIWSPQGNYLCVLFDYYGGSTSRSFKVFSRTGDSFSEMGGCEVSNGYRNKRSMSMSSNEDYLLIGNAETAQLFSRTGDNFSPLLEIAQSSISWGAAFSPDVTKVVAGAGVYTFNGASLTQLSGDAVSGCWPVFSAVDPNILFLYSTPGNAYESMQAYAYSVANDTVTSLGAVSGLVSHDLAGGSDGVISLA
jgi:hypothetical protein